MFGVALTQNNINYTAVQMVNTITQFAVFKNINDFNDFYWKL